jgi:hypothetical protein
MIEGNRADAQRKRYRKMCNERTLPNIGDLVKYRNPAPGHPQAMLVIEKGVYVGGRDVKVLCDDGNIKMTKSSTMEVINENR